MNTEKTLLAILVEELPKRGGWPDGANFIAADSDGDIDSYNNIPVIDGSGLSYRDSKSEGYFLKLINSTEGFRAIDWETAIITRDQYEAALAASQAPTADADGWIEWHGGECPVPEVALVEVKYRNEKSYHIKGINAAGKWNWQHDDHNGDIIAYRLHQPQDANTRANDDLLDAAVGLYSTSEGEIEEANLNECIGQAAPEWDGKGLPPVGAEFTYGLHRSRAKCLAVGRHFVFASKGDPDDEEGDYEEVMIDWQTDFYPVDEVRDRLASDIMKSSALRGDGAVKLANKLLAAGYRKQ